jgi:Flp pilus assembly protein TadG
MVEMAIVLPLLLVVVFGVGEYALGFHTLQAMTNAARDGARCLAVRGETDANARAVALDRLSHINANFTVTPSTSGRDVTVTITVPRSDVSLGLYLLLPPPVRPTLTAKVTMRKEGD